MQWKTHILTFLALTLLVAACGGNEDVAPADAVESESQVPADVGTSDPSESENTSGAMSPPKMAMYQGDDREALLIEAAADEDRRISWYTSSNPEQGTMAAAEAFEEKYGIAVEIWRGAGGAGDVALRVVEEYNAGRHNVDVIESTAGHMYSMADVGVLQSFALADPDAYPKGVLDPDGLFASFRESYVGVGYNTNVYSEDEVPRTYEDLLDPKWKGQLFIPSSSTGVRWVGAMRDLHGEDYIEALIQQDLKVMNVGGRALSDLVVAGEVPMSPTVFNSHMEGSIDEGAPVAWVPLEPVLTNTGTLAMAAEAPNPYSALLFIDFIFSEEGAQIYLDAGYQSPRTGALSEEFVFNYSDLERYYEYAETDDYDASFTEWQELLDRFVTESR